MEFIREDGDGVLVRINGEVVRLTKDEYREARLSGKVEGAPSAPVGTAPAIPDTAQRVGEVTQDVWDVSMRTDMAPVAGDIKDIYDPETIASANYTLTDVEMDRIIELKRDPSLKTNDDLPLIQKYNTWTTYFNAESKAAFDQAYADYEGRGPIEYLVNDAVMETGVLPASQIIDPALTAGTGVLYDLYRGEVTKEDLNLETGFLFTEEGAIPLSQEALENTRGFRVRDNSAPAVMFGLEGEDTYAIGTSRFPQYYDRPDERVDLPPGVTQGIPEGEDPNDYVSVAYLKNLGGTVGKPGDPFLYVKVLDQPVGEIGLRPAQRKVIEYPEMPNEPAYEEPLGFINRLEDPIDEIEEDDGGTLFAPRETPVEEKEKDPLDPMFGINLLAHIAKGLESWNMPGVSVQPMRFDQPQYETPGLGPAVTNLFRGGN